MTDRSILEQRTLALAGVAQAARIVDLAAKTGSWPEPFVEASIHSLFALNPTPWRRCLALPKASGWGLNTFQPVCD